MFSPLVFWRKQVVQPVGIILWSLSIFWSRQFYLFFWKTIPVPKSISSVHSSFRFPHHNIHDSSSPWRFILNLLHQNNITKIENIFNKIEKKTISWPEFVRPVLVDAATLEHSLTRTCWILILFSLLRPKYHKQLYSLLFQALELRWHRLSEIWVGIADKGSLLTHNNDCSFWIFVSQKKSTYDSLIFSLVIKMRPSISSANTDQSDSKCRFILDNLDHSILPCSRSPEQSQSSTSYVWLPISDSNSIILTPEVGRVKSVRTPISVCCPEIILLNI